MKLHTFSRAPHCRKVDIVMLEKGIDLERIIVDLSAKQNLQENFLALNPRGVLPLLELDDGTVFDESLAICRYLELLFPEPCLFGQNPREIALIASWERHMEFDGYIPAQEAFRNSFKPMADRAIAGFSSGMPAIPDLAARGEKRFGLFLQALEQRLQQCPFVGGDRFSVADITGILAIDIAKRTDMEIPQKHVATLRWYDVMYDRDSISSTYIQFK